jgi:hypothetical protein
MKNIFRYLSSLAFLGVMLFTANRALAQTSTTSTTTTSSDGTVSQSGPGAIVIKSTTSTAPVSYSYSKTTTYVDENGNPVSVETVKTGAPVVVYYEKNGDGYVADKVVVKKVITTTTPDAVVMVAPQPSTPPTVDGIVADADSDGISIRTATSDGKTHYKAHDATAYVDESGNPVSRKMLQHGTPVTIFYERDGDDLLATRVVVKNSIPVQ